MEQKSSRKISKQIAKINVAERNWKRLKKISNVAERKKDWNTEKESEREMRECSKTRWLNSLNIIGINKIIIKHKMLFCCCCFLNCFFRFRCTNWLNADFHYSILCGWYWHQSTCTQYRYTVHIYGSINVKCLNCCIKLPSSISNAHVLNVRMHASMKPIDLIIDCLQVSVFIFIDITAASSNLTHEIHSTFANHYLGSRCLRDNKQ